MDVTRWASCVMLSLCWICGEALGAHLCFVAGPMCGINRTSGEPPSHRDCAIWAARNCPFLVRPHMRRREDEFTETLVTPGVSIRRNPGVNMIWYTKEFTVFRDGKGNPLLQMGDPLNVEWYCEGRAATRDECLDSIMGGLPLLEVEAAKDGERAQRHLRRNLEGLLALLPDD
jgi:hypothetical protein